MESWWEKKYWSVALTNDGNKICYSHSRKTDRQFFKKLNIHLLYDAVIPLLHVYPREKKSYNVHTKSCTTHGYTDKRMDIQTWLICITESYSAIKKEWAIDTGYIACMNYKMIMLSKRNQIKKSNTVWFYLYKILGNGNQGRMTETRSVVT